MARFYFPDGFSESQTVFLTDPGEVHHLKDVLRLKAGDSVTLFDGRGKTALCRIVSVEKKRIELQVLDIEINRDPVLGITLACAVPKHSKFEWIVEKATELGAHRIIPVMTRRTEVIVKDPVRRKNRVDRFLSSAINAAKQCQSPTVPVVEDFVSFEKALNMLVSDGLTLIPSLMGSPKPILAVLSALEKIDRVNIFIGPEGDFTEEEYRSAFDAGAIPVSLGQTVLKVETAAFYALSCLNAFWGLRKSLSQS